MIDTVDQRITDWVKEVSGVRKVHLSAPPNDGDEDSVGLYLLSLQRVPSFRGTKNTTLKIFLHYLITTWSPSSEREHRTLSLLIFSAMSHEEFDVDTGGISPDLWRAFNLVPRPAFLLSVPLLQEMPMIKAPYVKAPLILKYSSMEQLSGLLLGENDHPLAGAKIELPQHHLITESNKFGEFQFSAVPITANKTLIQIHAKGQVQSVTANESWSETEPLTIRLNTMEV